MTPHQIIAILAKQVKTDEQAQAMWKRIFQAYLKNQIGNYVATELQIWLESNFNVDFQNPLK